MLCVFICVAFSGCAAHVGCVTVGIQIADNEYAKLEYDDDEKIVADDRYDDGDTFTDRINGRYYGGYEEFLGRRTIMECPSEDEKEVSVRVTLYTKNGKAKVVFADAENNVTALIEYESGDTNGQLSKEVNTTVKFLKGENKFKLVGYDCEDLNVWLELN